MPSVLLTARSASFRHGGAKTSALRIAYLLLLFIALAGAPRASGAGEERPGSALSTAPTSTRLLYTAISATIARHFEPSYITLGGGYNRSPAISWNDLLYEGQIYVHYTWNDTSRRTTPEQDKDLVRITLPIRLQVRQYTSESSPVKTPSYNPGIRMYYTRGGWLDEDGLFYLSLGLHHYSNGQSGPHSNADGTINTDTGSFSSDYAELSFYWDRKYSWTKFNFRKYLIGGIATWEPEQSHYYEKALAEITWRHELGRLRGAPSIQLTAGYKFNRDYISPGVNASFKDNLQWTAEAAVPIDTLIGHKQWQDVRFYFRWDKGFDYYNIHYQERMNRLQFGFAATNF